MRITVVVNRISTAEIKLLELAGYVVTVVIR